MIEVVTFLIIAVILIASAIFVVFSRHIFHSALVLMLFLFTMAAMYVHLKSELVAVIQVLTYVGGVITFILFVIMLTKKLSDMSVERFNNQKLISAIVVIFVMLCLILLLYFSFSQPLKQMEVNIIEDSVIGEYLLSDYLLSFELISIILTVVMIGAILLVKKEETR